MNSAMEYIETNLVDAISFDDSDIKTSIFRNVNLLTCSGE